MSVAMQTTVSALLKPRKKSQQQPKHRRGTDPFGVTANLLSTKSGEDKSKYDSRTIEDIDEIIEGREAKEYNEDFVDYMKGIVTKGGTTTLRLVGASSNDG